ncbi:MAG: histidine kinase [Eubacteriales bacterium]
MQVDDRLSELEKSLEDLQKRWPAHSVKPQMIEERENLEDEIALLKKQLLPGIHK